jgi:beta-galactosidase
MQFSREHFRWRHALVCAAAILCMYSRPGLGQVDATPLRITQSLHENWRFVQNDDLTNQAALSSNGEGWQTVNLPHTWNAVDAASTDLPGSYERGLGWYRLEFATPAAGVRHWLEIGAASLVADVWLNGRHLGEHVGGFTAFRFDVTDELAPAGTNVLLVKVDNRQPKEESDRTAIAPLGGDFNVSGGLYRHVDSQGFVDTPSSEDAWQLS